MNAEVPQALSCSEELSLRALSRLPHIRPGDDLAALIDAALRAEQLPLHDCDVLVVCSKIVAKAEDRYLDLSTVQPSARALELAAQSGKDARLVEAILQESSHVSRVARDVLVVRHKTGHVSANAGFDQSNVPPRAGTGPWVLRLPADPDGSAERLRAQLSAVWKVRLGVVISDSFGRPFRQGTVGAAIGCAGLPPLFDQRGRLDMFGRRLEHTLSATADQLAAAADLVAGQADEARPVVRVRGLSFAPSDAGASVLCRAPAEDLYL
ncbi:MAG TPA: coenzyme F420-0:L-glutamate ligase [Polyangiales bacterium]|nr:coenzyme F420-0:L-glutamate ligase [Polyangiales bacterium]